MAMLSGQGHAGWLATRACQTRCVRFAAGSAAHSWSLFGPMYGIADGVEGYKRCQPLCFRLHPHCRSDFDFPCNETCLWDYLYQPRLEERHDTDVVEKDV